MENETKHFNDRRPLVGMTRRAKRRIWIAAIWIGGYCSLVLIAATGGF